MSLQVDAQVWIFNLFRLGSHAFGTAQNSSHPRYQLLRIKGFGNIIVCTYFQTNYFICILVTGSKHNNGDVRLSPQRSTDIPSRYFRQHQVENNQIGDFSSGHVQGCLTFVGYDDLVTFLFEIGFQNINNLLLVIYDQYLLLRHWIPHLIALTCNDSHSESYNCQIAGEETALNWAASSVH